jgi:PAS domain S-box-containing protein
MNLNNMENISMGNIKIMIVEDEHIVAKEIKQRLEELGYSVSAVTHSGEDAIEIVPVAKPNLVLMDIMLEGEMDGVETARQLRNLYDIPVIYLTAYSDSKTLERAKVTEPFGYIVKPLVDRELHSTIEIAIYKHNIEKKLKENEQWLSTTLKSIGDGVITTDNEGKITFMNSVAEDLTGYKQTEVLGKNSEMIFSIIDEKTRTVSENLVLKILKKTNNIKRDDNVLLISREGKEIPIDESLAPIINEKGNPTGVVLVFRDISQRKALEEQLRHAQKMEAIGTLAGGVAHDFKNIITAIRVATDSIMSAVDKSGPAFEDLIDVQAAAKHASNLTHKLLLFSRSQSMDFKSVNLNHTIQGLYNILLRLINKDIKIDTMLEPELWPVHADQGTLEQVIINLILNAKDALPEGGLIEMKTENRILSAIDCKKFPDAQPGRHVRLSITDNGIGIDEKIIQYIYDPFFSTKESGKGTGLGLSVTYGIIKQHNGWIDVKSIPDESTSFLIYLPAISDKPRKDIKKDTSINTLQGKGEKILVVDDEEMVLKTVCRALTRNGYKLYDALNPEQAVDIFNKENGNFELLITDVVLSNSSGIDLAEELLLKKPDLHILVCSGYSDHETKWPVIKEKGFRYLSKPYDLINLLQSIREAIKD